MNTRYMTAGVVATLIGIAYVGGYWPEHRHRITLEAEVTTLRARLTDAEARVRMGRLLGEVLSIREAVASLNFGLAQRQSSALFDTARAEASGTPVTSFKATLEALLQKRDHVTAALARGEPATVEPLLQQAELRLRDALGYPVSEGRSTARLSGPAR